VRDLGARLLVDPRTRSEPREQFVDAVLGLWLLARQVSAELLREARDGAAACDPMHTLAPGRRDGSDVPSSAGCRGKHERSSPPAADRSHHRLMLEDPAAHFLDVATGLLSFSLLLSHLGARLASPWSAPGDAAGADVDVVRIGELLV